MARALFYTRGNILKIDIHLHADMLFCMRITLNLPDDLVAQAKHVALVRKTTLTAIIIRGLKFCLKQDQQTEALPVSSAAGGLCEGVEWDNLASCAEDPGFDEWYR
ncbi:MAG: hypothetical protein D6B26_03810 [Spirochaetaceae bacterium]|nr:MAG: hypothetical protein D6B26_03810 [Spirochaetaceae bacterium]